MKVNTYTMCWSIYDLPVGVEGRKRESSEFPPDPLFLTSCNPNWRHVDYSKIVY